MICVEKFLHQEDCVFDDKVDKWDTQRHQRLVRGLAFRHQRIVVTVG